MSSRRPPNPQRLWIPVNPLNMPGWLVTANLGLLAVILLSLSRWIFPIFLVPAIIALVVVNPIVLIRHARRFLRQLDEHQGRICLRCHYILSGLVSPGVCPECQEPFDHESIARIWQLWKVHEGSRFRPFRDRHDPRKSTPPRSQDGRES